jgi:hypothetical protein
MTSKMPAYGWKLETVGDLQVWSQVVDGNIQLIVRINPILDPRKWSITEY